jgi:NADPH:quinone reductase-like Zn-dependent oxidoreductase
MENKMKAIVYEKYGPPEVLHLADIEKPSPKYNEVLIKVHAASVTKYDTWMRSCTAPPGFKILMRIASGRTPKQPILGTELAGKVVAVGKDVTRFKINDDVYGYPGMRLGAYTEYISLQEEAVAHKPNNVSYEEAASVLQGAMTAWYFLSKANIQPGQKVLIFGASGGVGGYAVQLAKYYFKAEVTGVCRGSKIDYVKSLGADYIIDYKREDFTQNNKVYDVVFDTVGKSPVFRTKKSITPSGWYLLATFGLPMLIQLLLPSKNGKRNLEYGTLAEKNEDLLRIKNLIETGVIRPTVDRSYPLEQADDAHRYVESGQKMGSVILVIDQESNHA